MGSGKLVAKAALVQIELGNHLKVDPARLTIYALTEAQPIQLESVIVDGALSGVIAGSPDGLESNSLTMFNFLARRKPLSQAQGDLHG